MRNRREFIKTASAFSAVTAAAPTILNAQGVERTFNVAIIGAGRRASEAFGNMREAAKQLGYKIRLVAVHDYWLNVAKARCKQFECDEKYAFGGATQYRAMLEVPGIEIVILGAPPAFRPLHLEACIQADKHVFAEKPIAVDPQGVRSALKTAAAAKAKALTLVAGTQRRYDRAYLTHALAFSRGQLGTIRGGNIYWCQGHGSIRRRQPGVTNAEYMAHNWMNWAQMSGDHIVEQHVHNIDVANWFIGRYPRTAMGVGSRVRRPTGNQYDFFSVDFDYGDGLHIHSLARQIPGCSDRIGEIFATELAEVSAGGKVRFFDGREVELERVGHEGNPLVNEHRALLESVVKGAAANDGENIVYSTATAIMGRLSAYTGQVVRMSDIMTNSESPFYNMNFAPAAVDFESDKDVELPKEDDAPRAGRD